MDNRYDDYNQNDRYSRYANGDGNTYHGGYADEYPEEQYDPEVLEQIRLAKLRRARADQLARDRLHAEMVMVGAAVVVLIIVVALIIKAGNKSKQAATYTGESSSQTVESSADDVNYVDEPAEDSSSSYGSESSLYAGQAEGHDLVVEDGIAYVDGIMIVNKTFSLPSTYDPGLNAEAEEAFSQLQAAAWNDGVTLWICSGYRTYEEQETLFDNYASQRGLSEADAVSARPGHSEHQTGLCFDVNTTDSSFAGTTEAIWIANNCATYGFIVRFPEGKEDITGYDYEPWHIRYVGVEAAQEITSQGLCLEEYLNVTSDYADSPENEEFIEKYAQYDDSSSVVDSYTSYDNNTYNTESTSDYTYGTDTDTAGTSGTVDYEMIDGYSTDTTDYGTMDGYSTDTTDVRY